MLNLREVQLMHRHRDGQSYPMTTAEPSAASADPEREWRKGAELYECSACNAQIEVSAEAPGAPGAPGDRSRPSA